MIKHLFRKFINLKLIRKVRMVIARYFGNNHIIGLRGNKLKADELLMKRVIIHFYGKNNNVIICGGGVTCL